MERLPHVLSLTRSPDNYLNAVTCYVGEDGKLRLGLRMSGVTWDAGLGGI